MTQIFETFKPQSSIIKKYVDYYYLEIKPDSHVNEFLCFPHFNNTISLYKSHILLKNREVVFNKSAKSCQIFTPIRQIVLKVKQTGPVYRIVIVFFPLGVQQFYTNTNFADYITDFNFFAQNELNEIFSTIEADLLTTLIDSFLEKRFKNFENIILERSIQFIFKNCESFSVIELSKNIGVSRQHLNRLFQSQLGVSVKKFYEIVLFRKTVNRKLFENPKENFTELAYEFNFNDQSHFNKRYKSLTGNSPRSFFKKGTVLGKEDTFWHLQS